MSPGGSREEVHALVLSSTSNCGRKRHGVACTRRPAGAFAGRSCPGLCRIKAAKWFAATCGSCLAKRSSVQGAPAAFVDFWKRLGVS